MSFNYDIKNAYFLQRRFLGYYNAQCCGVTAEFQTFNFGGFNYGGVLRPTVQQDRRFSISISLAGIGSFSPPFGGMSPTGGLPVGEVETGGQVAMVKVLVTGGAGFIGSNFVRYALRTHPDWHVTTLDKLTYCGRLENLHDVIDNPRHTFVQGDIADSAVSAPLVRGAHIVVHFAAETHVDRSLQSAGEFIHTDVFGTFALLEAARQATGLRRFVQISTDEVYGSVPTGASKETDELRPRNPYSASKAGADRLAYSYWATYQVPVVVTRASNNYGPYQFPEKVIPLFITNALEDGDLPLYGDGMNVRDWLHVDDHCSAVDLVIEQGRRRRGLQHRRRERGAEHRADAGASSQLTGKPDSLIRPVADRLGHDRRYALDTSKLRALGWAPRHVFADGLAATVEWYKANPWWWQPIKHQDPAFQAYYQAQYSARTGA